MRRVISEPVEEFARHTGGEFVSNPGRREGKTATESAMEREQRELRGHPTAMLDFGGFRAEMEMRTLNPNYMYRRGFQPGDRIRLPLYVKEPARYMAGGHPQRQVVLLFQHVGSTPTGSRNHPLFILEGIEGIGEESKSSDRKVLKLKPGAKRKIIL
jgi:hypothetical protein